MDALHWAYRQSFQIAFAAFVVPQFRFCRHSDLLARPHYGTAYDQLFRFSTATPVTRDQAHPRSHPG
jgi:hypothetical protein